MVVFGTSHRVQGAEHRRRNIDDPSYSHFLNKLINDYNIDFVFEEASGLGPTIAAKLTCALLDSNRYLDVDPSMEVRPKLRINDSGSTFWIDPSDESRGIANIEIPREHQKREELWLKCINAQRFTNGLIVCGFLHTLSFAFNLQKGFRVTAFYYMPHHKLGLSSKPRDEGG